MDLVGDPMIAYLNWNHGPVQRNLAVSSPSVRMQVDMIEALLFRLVTSP